MMTDSITAGTNDETATGRRDLLPLALGLAALLFAVKVVLLPFPVSNVTEFLRWVLRLAVVGAPDVCFVAGLTVFCWSVMRVAAQWIVPRRMATLAVFLLFYVCGLYAIASVPMYQVMKLPLTLPLLSYAGGPVLMGSSIFELVSPGLFIALAVVPLAMLVAPRLARSFSLESTLPQPGMKSALAALCLIAAYGAVCHAYVQANWTDPNRWERRIAKSPHAVMLGSCVTEWLKDRPLTLTTVFPDADESDFNEEWNAYQFPCNNRLVRGSRPKNVILIVLESTGVEYLGLYGSKYPTTPHLERLAKEQGVVFDNVYVQTPNSCKSLVALTASVYPETDWRLIVRDCPDFNVPTMANVLVKQGYRTCFSHSGYWGWKNRDNYLTKRGAQTLIDAERLPGAKINSWGVSDRAMYQATLDWIDERPGKPFFALAYTIETHHPYVSPPQPYDFGVSDPELGRYLNAVRAADEHIGWLMEQLQQRGLADSTLVAVTSDHGESFGQHDQRVHSFGVYEPDVHVPLVLLHPSLADGFKRESFLSQHIDIPPTLLGLLRVDASAEWQGLDLLSCFPLRERIYFFSTGNEVVLGLRENRGSEHKYKYHYYVDSGREELFDLATDAGELTNLAAEQPDRCAGYRRRVGGLVQSQRRFLAEHGAK